jgi:hypothetical protein
MRKSRRFQAGAEGLEERLALSTAAASAHAIPLTGIGTLTASNVNNAGGEVQVSIKINGGFSPLGDSTGMIQTTIVGNSLHFNAVGSIQAANGDMLNIEFSGQNQKVRVHQLRATGRYRFVVNGGTGAFSNASGSGIITVTQNLVSSQPVEFFSLHGKIRK